jgi:hypothetical protein
VPSFAGVAASYARLNGGVPTAPAAAPAGGGMLTYVPQPRASGLRRLPPPGANALAYGAGGVGPASTADLSLEGALFDPQNPIAGQRFQLQLLITNTGSSPTRAGKVGVWLDLAPTNELKCGAGGADVTLSLPRLKPGASKLINSKSKKLTVPGAGTKNMRVFINAKCDAANPGLQYVLLYTVTAGPMPDLELLPSFTGAIKPVYPSTGAPFSFSLLVANVGTGAMSAGVKVAVWAGNNNTLGYAEPRPCGAANATALLDVPPLQPFQAVPLTFEGLIGGPSGYVNGSYVLAYADALCTLDEPNEALKQQGAAGYFVVPSPMAFFEVVVTGISPKKAKRGKPLTVKVNVTNTGGGPGAIGKVPVWATTAVVPSKWCTSGSNAAAVGDFPDVLQPGQTKEVSVMVPSGLPAKRGRYLMAVEADSGCANSVPDPPRNSDPDLPKLPPSALALFEYRVT